MLDSIMGLAGKYLCKVGGENKLWIRTKGNSMWVLANVEIN